MKKGVVAVAAALLLAAVVSQFLPKQESEPGKGRHLDRVLPRDLTGWTGKEVPLGATEAATGAVEKTLQFDDVYFREFSSGGRSLSLYVAYWGPGKMPTQLVASHTPDRCWVENGWTCEQVQHAVRLGAEGDSLLPAEWRVFKAPNSQRLTVAFWHRVGPELYDYGLRTNRVPSVWRWWRDAARQVFRAPPEQYFIRLSADRAFTELAEDGGWQELVVALGDLGLRDVVAVK